VNIYREPVPITYKKFSWCWQARATPSEVSQGHQT